MWGKVGGVVSLVTRAGAAPAAHAYCPEGREVPALKSLGGLDVAREPNFAGTADQLGTSEQGQ